MKRFMQSLTLATVLISLIGVVTHYQKTLAQGENESEGFYAISNTGQIIDIKAQAFALAQKSNLRENYLSGIHPPHIPASLNVVEEETLLLKPIPPDYRQKVTDTSIFPWSAVTKVRVAYDNIAFDCSGWMLGTSTVATAAHCIYNRNTNTFATDAVITPGLNTDAAVSKPFGQCTSSLAWIPQKWITEQNPIEAEKYDYGIYALNCRVGEETGSLGFIKLLDEELDGQRVNVVGYPLEFGGSTMWYGLGDIIDTLNNFLFYNNDTSGGQSGSPVWELIPNNCQACVVAIHSGDGVGDYNVGMRVNDYVFDFLFGFHDWEYHGIYLPLIGNNTGTLNNPLDIWQDPYPAPITDYKIEKNRNPYPAP